jgi:hypothetical protein
MVAQRVRARYGYGRATARVGYNEKMPDLEDDIPTLSLPLRDLDAWARACADSYADLTRAEGRLVHDADIHEARQYLHSAREEMWHTLQSLVRAGAERPTEATERMVRLPLLTSAKNCRLLALLEEAVEVSEGVDAERGLLAGSRRTDRLRGLRDHARTEVRGPEGIEDAPL